MSILDEEALEELEEGAVAVAGEQEEEEGEEEDDGGLAEAVAPARE